jgi:hypothetical protein
LTCGVTWGKINSPNKKEIMLKLRSKSGLESYVINPDNVAAFWHQKSCLKLFLKGGQIIEIYNYPKESGDEWENYDGFLFELSQIFKL